ncbi:hypothetical protein PGT21_050224 [Puccinia graminis f. sp. tritici]|uniref:BED-type domain-containing protein n=1 Tax=Puccinia graminis f. sp. tritici TaxID=56615 RepID=A0A5B0P0Y5_PUCGR|nr:hypothetical protein PGT21_050224 [Puccinia graminis f. sp. tritici]
MKLRARKASNPTKSNQKKRKKLAEVRNNSKGQSSGSDESQSSESDSSDSDTSQEDVVEISKVNKSQNVPDSNKNQSATSATDSTSTQQPPRQNKAPPADKSDTNTLNISSKSDIQRKTTSDIWEHYKPVGKGEEKRAICNYCRANMSAKSSCGTTPLWRHLDRCKNFSTQSKQTLLKMTSGSGTTPSNWTFNQEECRELLTKLIIADEKPFKSVEHPIFKAFLAALQPRFKLHGRITVKKDIIKMYNSMKAKVSREISEADRVALTTDLWTSSNQTPFMVVSAHFISPDWILKKRVISFKELPPPHSGIAIADQLICTIIDWKILDKVSFITVDNASANNVAVARVSTILKEKSQRPPDLNCEFLHLQCAAHVINLVVKDAFQIISSAIARIRSSVQYVKSTPSHKQKFQEAIAMARLPSQALPSTDVATRWNSTYLMLKSALPYREAFSFLSIQDSGYTHCPTPNEWDEILAMKDFLSIFNTATLNLGMTHHPTAHVLYKNMVKIENHLKQAANGGPDHIANLINPMEQKFNKYWEVMKDFAEIAVVFDPRYKIDIIEFNLSVKHNSDQAAISCEMGEIKKKIYSWYNQISSQAKTQNESTKSISTPSQSQPSAQEEVPEDIDEAHFKKFLAGKKSNMGVASSTAELDLYLQEATLDTNSKPFDVLKWWSINSLRFPVLSTLARQILTAPMTSIASESAFSTGGRILSDYRSRLSPGTLEALVCGKDWIDTDEGISGDGNGLLDALFGL